MARDGDEDLVRRLVVGRLEDLDDVVAAERHVRVEQPAAALLNNLFRLLHAVAPGGNPAEAL